MSFIVTPVQDEDALASVRQAEGWAPEIIRFGNRCLAYADPAVCVSTAIANGREWALTGHISNHRELRQTLAMFDSAALTTTHAGLLAILVQHMGNAGLSLVDGAFVLFCDDPESGLLVAAIDVLGQYPLYATKGTDAWMAPAPRLAARKPGFTPDFVPENEVLKNANRADDYVPIRNMLRFKPGCTYGYRNDGMGHGFTSQQPFHTVGTRQDREISLAEGMRGIADMLIPSIRGAFDWDGTACVPLSGGVDSSIVAAVGAQFTDLHTLAMGTQRSNEYVPAKHVADHIGSSHREIEISTDDILDGLFDSIYYNGIFDGYAAEVQASLFALIRDLRGQADLVVTGYGADLLMGGTLTPGNLPSVGVNNDLWAQVYRTRWSSEFSPVGANSFGMQIRHPFWTPRFLGFCLDLPADLKVSSDEVKIALRSFADAQKILPDETVWRKKIAMHHGSSVEDILSDALGVKMNPHAKEVFAYTLFRDAVAGTLTPENFTPAGALARCGVA